MAEMTEKPQIYYIPDNFIDETRIFQGQIRLRYFIEGVILGGILALIGFAIPISNVRFRVSFEIIVAAPGVILGIVGFNGDPISVAIRNWINWSKNKAVRLYNPNPRLLGSSPSAAIDAPDTKDRLVDMYDSYQSRKLEKAMSEEYVEGETFVFLDDPDVDDFTVADGETVGNPDDAVFDTGKNEIRLVSLANMADFDDLSDLEDDDWSKETDFEF